MQMVLIQLGIVFLMNPRTAQRSALSPLLRHALHQPAGQLRLGAGGGEALALTQPPQLSKRQLAGKL